MEKHSARFGQLLKAGLNSIATIEGKTGPIIDDEIGALVGLAGTSLQRYRTGALPDVRFIKIVADACVKRGLLGRSWLEQFLKAANYPLHEARALMISLFPETLAQTRQAVPRSNLPAAHGRFVMRRAAYDATMAGLLSETPLTVIVSLGGMGKSSLARAVAVACLAAEPTFATVAWVSDKDRPGTTNLSTTLDELARVLDYPGILSLPNREKQREIEALLGSQPVLLVLDNAETISDAALLEWVDQLPHPSRALATSRVHLPEHIRHTVVELEPLDQTQARELIAERLAQAGWRTRPAMLPQLLPLAEVAGGNPKAIELALGLVLRQHRPLDEAIQALRGARMAELFDDLFAQAWALLNTDARRVFLAMPLFVGSASEQALAYCADLSPAAAERALTKLVELSLLDADRIDFMSLPRYTAHPLVRAFAQARLAADPTSEAALRMRWLRWCADVGNAVGFCWYNLDLLAKLDDEHSTLQVALEWSAQHKCHQETLELCEGVRYYYNVRGLWDQERLHNYTRRRIAAHALGNPSEVVLALTQEAEVLSKQNTLPQATVLLHEAIQYVLAEAGTEQARLWHELPTAQREAAVQPAELVAQGILSSDAAFELGHARALLAYTRGDLVNAEGYWRDLLPFSERLETQKYSINRRWLATCLLDQGRSNEAAALYRESLADARRANDTRSVTGNTLKLAAIDIARSDLAAAQASLSECRAVATRYADRRRLAECHRLSAQLAMLRNDIDTATSERQQAIDLFERMGMRREAEATRQMIVERY